MIKDRRDYNSVSSGSNDENHSSLRKTDHDFSPKRKHEPSERDSSPPRRGKRAEDLSPERDKKKSTRNTRDDFSPPRRSYKNDRVVSPRRSQTEKDSSPSRTRRFGDSLSSKREKGDDISPTRRSRSTVSDLSSWQSRSSEADSSPPRRSQKREVLSPIRKRKKK